MSVPQLTRDLEAPLQGPDDADRLAEWPELVGLEDLLLDNGQLPSHRADRPCPQELHVFPDDVSPELLQIISQPLDTERPPKSAGQHGENGGGRSPPPPSSTYSHGTSMGDDRSSLPVRTQAPAVKDHTGDNHLDRCFSPESTATGATFSRMGVKATGGTKNLKLRLLERNSFRYKNTLYPELADGIVPHQAVENGFLQKRSSWALRHKNARCFCGARGGTCGCIQPNQHGTKPKVEPDTITQPASVNAENERSERREVEERLRKETTKTHPEGDGQRRQDDGRRRVQHDKEMKRLISIANQIQRLQAELAKINKIQQSMIINRHQDSAQQIQVAAVSKQVEFDQTRVKLEKAYESNFKLRKGALEAQQSATKLELRTRQEEDEDDNFVQMQRHLKGKPNREEREKVILDKLNASHRREQDALEKTHKEELSELEYHGSLESSALQSGIMKKLGDLQRETNYTLYELSSTVISDRRWFKIAVEKRYGLLEEHRMFLINGPDAIKDTVTSSSRYSSANNSSHSGTTHSITSGRETPQSPLSPPPVFTEFGYRRRGSDARKGGGTMATGSRARGRSRNGLGRAPNQSQFVYR
ncbi:IBR domain containing protein [Trichophyton rubrum]|uniref:IBR domain containing protein n=1 Tax=Trichophyton rubrum TaxID=5551 RepID=A0A178EXR9_TRIRU|nr:IBR domain containing protein [Trichophyton rubrum]